jgi:hypothetical protein
MKKKRNTAEDLFSESVRYFIILYRDSVNHGFHGHIARVCRAESSWRILD